MPPHPFILPNPVALRPFQSNCMAMYRHGKKLMPCHEVNRGCGQSPTLSVLCITQSNIHLAAIDLQNRDGTEVARQYGQKLTTCYPQRGLLVLIMNTIYIYIYILQTGGKPYSIVTLSGKWPNAPQHCTKWHSALFHEC